MTAAPRHFYDCPIRAAYMAKYFGMRFQDDAGATIYPEWYDAYYNHGTCFFISPDSLPLLEPIVGDMVTNIGVRGYLVDRVEGDRLWSGDEFTMKNDARIIQRKGQAFFWPENEAA